VDRINQISPWVVSCTRLKTRWLYPLFEKESAISGMANKKGLSCGTAGRIRLMCSEGHHPPPAYWTAGADSATGVMIPRLWALVMAAERVRTFNLTYAPESRLRKVELATAISFESSVVRASG
jgi:hypothetical protein